MREILIEVFLDYDWQTKSRERFKTHQKIYFIFSFASKMYPRKSMQRFHYNTRYCYNKTETKVPSVEQQIGKNGKEQSQHFEPHMWTLLRSDGKDRPPIEID